MSFPMPNDEHPDGVVVASTHYGDHEHLATILVLRSSPPYFRVGIWDFDENEWHGNHWIDHANIVPAVSGEPLVPTQPGYADLGGDY